MMTMRDGSTLSALATLGGGGGVGVLAAVGRVFLAYAFMGAGLSIVKHDPLLNRKIVGFFSNRFPRGAFSIRKLGGKSDFL